MKLTVPFEASKSSVLALDYYWSFKKAAEDGVSDPFACDEREMVQRFDTLLRDSVRMRMVADVPLGAFLSGGVDSSAIVSLMQAQSFNPVRTFTIGFNEAAYNEAQHAKAVANHLGTDHTELYVTPREAMDVIPRLSTLYDEPFSDLSQIPTLLVSELARGDVTVSLSGDGGDELFGGYNRYFWGKSIWDTIGWMPKGLMGFAAKGITMVPPQTWESLFRLMEPVLPRKFRENIPGGKIHKLAEILNVKSQEDMYRRLISHWKEPASVLIGAEEPSTIFTEPSDWARLPEFTQRMMYLDTLTYLPDDILVKVDRAAMGVSLETRVPMLDHRVVEFAWRVPQRMKFRNSGGKWLLRKVVDQYVPKELIDRPKMGFGVPIDSWLKGPLRDWVESLLDQNRLQQEGFFDPKPIRDKWEQHLAGHGNHQYYLWDILMFQTWLESNKSVLN
jgi:asparagine synthase (glutamine-hydrolysing)